LGTRTSEENRKLVTVTKHPIAAAKDAHAIAILTEWDEFKHYDWKHIYDSMLKPAFLFDGRRLLDKKEIEEKGFKYYKIGQS